MKKSKHLQCVIIACDELFAGFYRHLSTQKYPSLTHHCRSYSLCPSYAVHHLTSFVLNKHRGTVVQKAINTEDSRPSADGPVAVEQGSGWKPKIVPCVATSR